MEVKEPIRQKGRLIACSAFALCVIIAMTELVRSVSSQFIERAHLQKSQRLDHIYDQTVSMN